MCAVRPNVCDSQYRQKMASKVLSVRATPSLLHQIDDAGRRMGLDRSGTVRIALSEFLAARRTTLGTTAGMSYNDESAGALISLVRQVLGDSWSPPEELAAEAAREQRP